ncbi:MAG: tetraacyldisaccharide 4'-kinase [Pseudomonadota bacterium]
MKPPHFWSGHLDPQSREAAPFTRTLLTPLAGIYAGVTARRIRNTAPTKLNIPVICVGNLTAGGSGKTPIVAAIRAKLSEQGIRAASLSRGYGGRLRGPTKVEVRQHDAADVGDEPLMLASTGEAWIARDRADGGEAMEAAGVDIVVMDDGHQNPSLAKDLSLVVIDSDDPMGNGYVIPKGPLREPVMAGLMRADGIVLTGCSETPDWLEDAPIPVLRSQLRRLTDVPDGPLIPFAGIGRPERFFSALSDDGADIQDTVSFPDHHMYSAKDLTFLKGLARDHSATLVTTEKDLVRLNASDQADITVIKVVADFEDDTGIDALLMRLISKLPT